MKLGNNNFSPDDGAVIANFFEKSTSLKHLSLTASGLGSRGCVAVVKGLARATALNELDLRNIGLRDGECYEALAEFLPKSRLQTLDHESDYDTWSPQNQAAAEPGRWALLGALNQTHLKLLELGLNEEERRAGWGNEST